MNKYLAPRLYRTPEAVAAILDPVRFREAWARVGRVEPVIPSETDAAARLASAENIDFCEALARVRYG